MAHKNQKEYCESVKIRHPEKFSNVRVLEIGSLNVNGSFRDLFKDCEYIGVDIVAGKDVDIVMKGHEYKDNKKYDVVCSGECFEHDQYWKQTIQNMINHTKKGGLLFFTCASTGRAEHGTRRTTGVHIWGTDPDYYYNISPEEFKETFDLDKIFNDYEVKYEGNSKDLYFKGIKK
jgi:SAM-dependent methyltransferase